MVLPTHPSLRAVAVRILGSALLLCVPVAHAAVLFADPAFEHGFRLTGASHARIELDGALRPPGRDAVPAEAPAWRLAQWGTRYLLEPGDAVTDSERGWVAENAGKRFALARDEDGRVTLTLAVNGIAEADGAIRPYGAPWPHLLIEQGFAAPVRVSDYDALPLSLAFRVTKAAPAAWAEGRLDPTLHTAQVSIFFTVNARAGDDGAPAGMIWFGIPLFDVRHPIPPGHQALDTGQPDASGKFICSLDGSRFHTRPTGDGTWHRVAVDLRPLLAEALAISQEHGHLTEAAIEDLLLTSFNLGWEVTGPYDAAIEIRGLALTGE